MNVYTVGPYRNLAYFMLHDPPESQTPTILVIAESHSEVVQICVERFGDREDDLNIIDIGPAILSGNLVDKRELHLGEEL